MASINYPFVFDGVDVMIKVLKDFDNNFEFTDDASEDFRNGFIFCKNLMITLLEDLENGGDK